MQNLNKSIMPQEVIFEMIDIDHSGAINAQELKDFMNIQNLRWIFE